MNPDLYRKELRPTASFSPAPLHRILIEIRSIGGFSHGSDEQSAYALQLLQTQLSMSKKTDTAILSTALVNGSAFL